MSQERQFDLALFIAIMSTVIAMSPSLAHLFALPNKIGLSRDDYFTAQGIYRGWNLFAYPIIVELLAILAVLILSWSDPRLRILCILALLGLLAAQTCFWLFTYPANVATDNWLRVPPDWEKLRRDWEYSHAAGAAFQFVSVTCLVLISLMRVRP